MPDLALYAITGFGVAFLGITVGLALGVLRLPLIFIIGLSPGVAAGTNIGVTAISSAIGSWSHFREGRLDSRLMVTMGVPAMAGSFVGGFVGGYISAWALLVLIATVVLWQGALFVQRGRMEMRPSQEGSAASDPQASVPRRHLILEVLLGVGIGFLGAMVGLALGVVRLPAMVQLLKIEPRMAVGTNLAIGFLSGVLGMVGRLVHGQVDFLVLGVMGLTAAVGSYYGAKLTGRIRPPALRVFMGVVLVLASILMFQQAYAEYSP